MTVGFWELFGIWTGTFFTLSMASFLWKNNDWYRFGQQFLVGGVIANVILVSVQSLNQNVIGPMLKGNLLLSIPLILGIMMYGRITKEWSWVSRYPISVVLGVGMGVTITGTLRGQVIDQAANTVLAVFKAGTVAGTINGLILLVGLITGLSFFLFTKEHTGALGLSAKIGRLFIMCNIGTSLGGEIIWHLSMVTGRAIFLYRDTWLKGVLGLLGMG